MYESKLFWSIQPVVAGVQLGNSLFLAALPMVVKERCINATRDSSLNSTSADSWQSTMSSFYMTYKILSQLMPIFPGLFLAWLGDRGWRKTPIVVPLMGFILSRLLVLLMLMLDWPLEVLWVEVTLSGLCGSFIVFWGGTMTLLSLSSADQDRSKLMMRAELTNGIAGVLGCVASGHLFDLTAAGLRPGVMTMLVCLLLYAICVLYMLSFLQVQTSSDCENQKELDTKATSDHRRQVLNIALLWVAGVLYDAAVSAAKHILVLFELMEPLHWSVAQVGYGNASGFLVILSSVLSATVMSRWVSDLTLITMGMLSYAAGIFLMAFVTTPYMFYIARTLTLMCVMPTPIIRSLLSQQVHGSSYCIVLTSLQLSLKVSGVVYNPLYIKIYQNTLNWFPGFVFIISSIITFVAIILIRILDRVLAVRSTYQQVHEDEDADEDDLWPLTNDCSDDINHFDE
ncbi:solute carrier family 46 member 2-like [Enoplosus armatus]|uniref:solute carrier family 46 member 2-like n=1 Tax=Enoplosus armatus TaxID=215367 RepID=UPI003994A982